MSNSKYDERPRRGGLARSFGAGTEKLCQTMPEIGMMPFDSDVARNRQLVRLVSTTPGADLSIELQPGENRIGRQRSNNHIVLVSPQVSRFHAEIHIDDEQIVLRDLGSANGTFVNGERITTARELRAGDLIAFSDQFTLRLLIDLELGEPESMTLDAASTGALQPTLPPEDIYGDEKAEAQQVPQSLERRLRSSPAIDPASLVAPIPSQSLRIGPTPVEIAPEGADPAQAARPRRKTAPLPAPLPPAPAFGPAETPTTPWDQRQEAPSPWPALAPQTDEEPDYVAQEATRSSHHVSPATPRVDRERRQLKVLYQVSKRCMNAQSLEELDSLLVGVLERAVKFNRGFLTYQLPSGDWKLVLSPAGERWGRHHVRDAVQLALAREDLVVVPNSSHDHTLGHDGVADSRLLLPLRCRGIVVGAVFLLSVGAAFDDEIGDFLALFGDIAALALVNCSRGES